LLEKNANLTVCTYTKERGEERGGCGTLTSLRAIVKSKIISMELQHQITSQTIV